MRGTCASCQVPLGSQQSWMHHPRKRQRFPQLSLHVLRDHAMRWFFQVLMGQHLWIRETIFGTLGFAEKIWKFKSPLQYFAPLVTESCMASIIVKRLEIAHFNSAILLQSGTNVILEPLSGVLGNTGILAFTFREKGILSNIFREQGNTNLPWLMISSTMNRR